MLFMVNLINLGENSASYHRQLNTHLLSASSIPFSLLADEALRFTDSLRSASLASSDAAITQITTQSGVLGNPFVFATPLLPTGIATDQAGNIFVSSENGFRGEDGIPRSLGSIITKYSSSGTTLGQINAGELFSPVDVVAASRFALDPISGLLLSLSPSGQINFIEPTQGIVTPWVDLKTIAIQTNNVYDVVTGQALDFTGAIQTSLSSYGDIAIFNGGNFFDIYVTGIGAGQAYPFISRLRLSQTLGNSAQVIMSTQAIAAPSEQSPPGIAVNPQGTVLTTLGVNRTTAGNFSAPVVFTVNFDPLQVTDSNRPLVLSNVDLSSRGMTADASGNFYIATGTIGTSLGGANGSGAILSLSPNLELTGIYTQGVVASAQDVAVSPDGQFLYATVGTNLFSPSGVLGFQLVQPTSTALPDGLTLELV